MEGHVSHALMRTSNGANFDCFAKKESMQK